LVLNPKVFTESKVNQILGGVENPYLKVKGNSQATETEAQAVELVSGERKYSILSQKYTEDTGTTYSYYYISKTIIITDYVSIDSISVKDRVYKGTITNNTGITIQNKEIFTSDINLYYELLVDSSGTEKYKNLSRDFTLKIDTEQLVTIPAGTEITMKHNDIYYNYIVESDTTKIPLNKFKDANEIAYSGGFTDLRGVDEVNVDYNEITYSTTYSYEETYRFIVNFSNTKTPISSGIYYTSVNINDNNEWIDEGQEESANTIQIQEREYKYNYQLNREEYEGNGRIDITGQLQLSEVTQEVKDTDLLGRMKLLNNSSEQIDIPIGTIITINGIQYEIYNGTLQSKLVENVSNEEILQTLNISVDMSGVLPQNRLEDSEYKLILELVLSKRNLNQEIFEIPIIIKNTGNYGIKAELLNLEELKETQLQLIRNDNRERTINLQYIGELEEPKVKIIALEKTGEFTYEETENSKKIITKLESVSVEQITSLAESQEISIIFEDDIQIGTYRIKFELSDKYNENKQECIINFIVL